MLILQYSSVWYSTVMPAYELNNDIDLVIQMIHEAPYLDNIHVHIYDEYVEMYGVESSKHGYWCHVLDQYLMKGKSIYMVELFSIRDDGHMRYMDYKNKMLYAVPDNAFLFLDAPQIIICIQASDMKCLFQMTCFQKHGWIRNDLTGTSSIKVMEETIYVCILVE